MSGKLYLVGSLLIGLASIATAADPPATEKVFRCKIADARPTCGAACAVNFSQQLGVPLEYLGSIGHRISQARRAPDPVDLALAAQALAVAEKVAGKKAAITAEQVQAESLELAKMRGVSSELAALALILPDQAIQQDLQKQLTLARKRDQEAQESSKSDEVDKELFGTLTVTNHTAECLRIYVGGRYVGTVHAGYTGNYHVHDHNNPTHFDAYCEEDGELVREANLFGHHHRAYWHIH